MHDTRTHNFSPPADPMKLYGHGSHLIRDDVVLSPAIREKCEIHTVGGWKMAVGRRIRLICPQIARNGRETAIFTPDILVFREITKKLLALVKIGPDLSAGRETMRYTGFGVNCYVIPDEEALEHVLMDIRKYN